jgi:hypothetical protein
MTNNVIIQVGNPLIKEALVSGALLPGMLVRQTNATTDTVAVHAVEGGTAQIAVLLEDDLQGKGVTDAYTTATRGRYGVFKRGEEFLGRLAAGNNLAAGAALASNGDGYLKATDVADSSGGLGGEFVVGYLRVACNATSAAQLCIVEAA